MFCIIIFQYQLRLKIIAYEFLHGKKPNLQLNEKWIGDALGNKKLNPRAQEFIDSVNLTTDCITHCYLIQQLIKCSHLTHTHIHTHIHTHTHTHTHSHSQMTAYQEVNGDKKRLYSCHVTKLNRRLKSDQWVLVLGEKHLYRLNSDYQLAKRGTIELEMITGLSISTGKDQTIVIHCVVSQ